MQSENQDRNPYSNGFEYGVRHLLSPRSGLLIDVLLSTPELLSEWIPALSRESFDRLLKLGSIYVSGKRVLKDLWIEQDTYVRLHLKPRRFPMDHGNWQPRVIFENEEFIVVDKPAGLPVHASVDNVQENLQSYLSTYFNRPLFVTHRLDVPTRGLLVFAKTKEFLSEFNRLLSERLVKKIYRARVEGSCLVSGLQQHFMEPSPRAPKKVSSEPMKDGAECLLQILTVENLSDGRTQEVSLELLTGRTHQIRAQLSALGAPILGDTAYGAKLLNEGDMIALAAVSLRFNEHTFELQPPYFD